ncbi:MAG: hypothetical protein QOD29_1230, partial [Alphaproteobacteria bacterium]|nr:hypothetical protein [Alphaproteobacteria bacterium]
MTPFQHSFGTVQPVTNYCSLVDMRCRPFIHWMRAASVYRTVLPVSLTYGGPSP